MTSCITQGRSNIFCFDKNSAITWVSGLDADRGFKRGASKEQDTNPSSAADLAVVSFYDGKEVRVPLYVHLVRRIFL